MKLIHILLLVTLALFASQYPRLARTHGLPGDAWFELEIDEIKWDVVFRDSPQNALRRLANIEQRAMREAAGEQGWKDGTVRVRPGPGMALTMRATLEQAAIGPVTEAMSEMMSEALGLGICAKLHEVSTAIGRDIAYHAEFVAATGEPMASVKATPAYCGAALARIGQTVERWREAAQATTRPLPAAKTDEARAQAAVPVAIERRPTALDELGQHLGSVVHVRQLDGREATGRLDTVEANRIALLRTMGSAHMRVFIARINIASVEVEVPTASPAPAPASR